MLRDVSLCINLDYLTEDNILSKSIWCYLNLTSVTNLGPSREGSRTYMVVRNCSDGAFFLLVFSILERTLMNYDQTF